MRTPCLLLAAGLAVAGCGSDESNEASPPSNQPDAAVDVEQDTTIAPDAADEAVGEAAADAVQEEAGPDPTAVCAELGLPSVLFVDAPDDDSLRAMAADLTVPTTEGDWNLKENWSGCDVYLFIQDQPRQAKGWPIALWDRDVDTLVAASPPNVHYFFLPTGSSDSEIAAALDALRGRVDTALAELSDDERTSWSKRVHYVTKTARLLDGWLGSNMKVPNWGVGIDRTQRIRYIGSYADPSRFDSGEQWFAPNLSMVANEAVYYNFEAEREATLEDTDTVIPLFDAAVDASALTVDVDFPDAATMAGFDTLELDLTLGCGGDGEYGVCPAWDRIVTLYLCDASNPDQCDTELGRWITSYHREGRWVHDVSPLLPLLAGGGTRRLRFDEQDPWEVTARLRFSNQGKAERATSATFLFSSDGGDGFDENYNDLHDSVVVPIPASAKRVEIASAITGHGMSMPGNCAEFCNTKHHFLVNGDDFTRDFPIAGSMFGCRDQTREGTVPNQYGTWWYGRSGWCPGKEVPMVTTDVTASVTPGEDATVELEAYWNGAPYSGDNWRFIQHSSWLVVYE